LVVLLLVVVWLVALVPVALRKLSEWQVTASVARFRHQRRVMSKSLAYPPPPVGVRALPVPRQVVGTGKTQSAWAQHRGRERSARLVARRRRVLARLTASLALTLVLGAVPALRFLWDLSLVSFFLTSGYIALLVRVQQLAIAEAAESERAEKVVSIHARAGRVEGSAAAYGSFGHSGSPGQARPAYVLVDVPG